MKKRGTRRQRKGNQEKEIEGLVTTEYGQALKNQTIKSRIEDKTYHHCTDCVMYKRKK